MDRQAPGSRSGGESGVRHFGTDETVWDALKTTLYCLVSQFVSLRWAHPGGVFEANTGVTPRQTMRSRDTLRQMRQFETRQCRQPPFCGFILI